MATAPAAVRPSQMDQVQPYDHLVDEFVADDDVVHGSPPHDAAAAAGATAGGAGRGGVTVARSDGGRSAGEEGNRRSGPGRSVAGASNHSGFRGPHGASTGAMSAPAIGSGGAEHSAWDSVAGGGGGNGGAARAVPNARSRGDSAGFSAAPSEPSLAGGEEEGAGVVGFGGGIEAPGSPVDAVIEDDEGNQVATRTSGFLRKKGGGISKLGRHSWKRRWFVLAGTRLAYFGKQTDTKTKGIINLEGAQVRTGRHRKYEFYFEIAVAPHPHGRVYQLAAETAEQMQEWLVTLDYVARFGAIPEELPTDGTLGTTRSIGPEEHPEETQYTPAAAAAAGAGAGAGQGAPSASAATTAANASATAAQPEGTAADPTAVGSSASLPRLATMERHHNDANAQISRVSPAASPPQLQEQQSGDGSEHQLPRNSSSGSGTTAGRESPGAGGNSGDDSGSGSGSTAQGASDDEHAGEARGRSRATRSPTPSPTSSAAADATASPESDQQSPGTDTGNHLGHHPGQQRDMRRTRSDGGVAFGSMRRKGSSGAGAGAGAGAGFGLAGTPRSPPPRVPSSQASSMLTRVATSSSRHLLSPDSLHSSPMVASEASMHPGSSFTSSEVTQRTPRHGRKRVTRNEYFRLQAHATKLAMELEDMRAQWPMALRAAQVHASAVALATAGAAAATPQGRARAAELQARHEQASERIVKLNRQTQEQQRKIHQVEGALANVHQRAQAAEAAVLQLQAERAALVDRVGTLQRGMDNLHAQLDESRTYAAELEDKADMQQSGTDEQVQALAAQLEEARAATHAAQAQAYSESLSTAKLAEALGHSRAELAAAQRETRGASEAAGAAKEDLAAARSECERSKKELAYVEQEVQRVMAKHATAAARWARERDHLQAQIRKQQQQQHQHFQPPATPPHHGAVAADLLPSFERASPIRAGAAGAAAGAGAGAGAQHEGVTGNPPSADTPWTLHSFQRDPTPGRVVVDASSFSVPPPTEPRRAAPAATSAPPAPSPAHAPTPMPREVAPRPQPTASPGPGPGPATGAPPTPAAGAGAGAGAATPATAAKTFLHIDQTARRELAERRAAQQAALQASQLEHDELHSRVLGLGSSMQQQPQHSRQTPHHRRTPLGASMPAASHASGPGGSGASGSGNGSGSSSGANSGTNGNSHNVGGGGSAAGGGAGSTSKPRRDSNMGVPSATARGERRSSRGGAGGGKGDTGGGTTPGQLELHRQQQKQQPKQQPSQHETQQQQQQQKRKKQPRHIAETTLPYDFVQVLMQYMSPLRTVFRKYTSFSYDADAVGMSLSTFHKLARDMRPALMASASSSGGASSSSRKAGHTVSVSGVSRFVLADLDVIFYRVAGSSSTSSSGRSRHRGKHGQQEIDAIVDLVEAVIAQRRKRRGRGQGGGKGRAGATTDRRLSFAQFVAALHQVASKKYSSVRSTIDGSSFAVRFQRLYNEHVSSLASSSPTGPRPSAKPAHRRRPSASAAAAGGGASDSPKPGGSPMAKATPPWQSPTPRPADAESWALDIPEMRAAFTRNHTALHALFNAFVARRKAQHSTKVIASDDRLTFGDVSKMAHEFQLAPQLVSVSGLLRLFRQVKEEDSEAHAALHGRQPSDAHLEVLSYPQFIEVLGRVALQAFTLRRSGGVAPGEAVSRLLRAMDSSGGLAKLQGRTRSFRAMPRLSVSATAH